MSQDTEPFNTYEMRARDLKAGKLAEYLIKIGLIAAEVVNGTDAEWNQAAKQAGVRPPSTETRRRVIEIMREQEGKVPW